MAKSELIMKALRQALQDTADGPIGEHLAGSKMGAMSQVGTKAPLYFDPAAVDTIAPQPAPMSQLQAAGTRGGAIQPDAADAFTAGVTAPAIAGGAGGAAAAGMKTYVDSQQPKWKQQQAEQDWSAEQERKLQAQRLGLAH